MADENQPFISVHSLRALLQELENAEALIDDQGTAYPDATYEDGVTETIRWLLGKVPPPTSDAINA
ncbi:hypothetical protein [Grimontia hollisae]|uniref:hypothetical protein n=1 Tax=Grimontia hollisae TaxID=673 RepID=UPI000E056C6F|nr:hypothetical protein [Grimontia hollisae]STQ75511.1 Uncharacterised protein [Grimontia hollisae]